ncbi:MAG: hypothetical protein QOH89_1043 [Pseudonocardiales bacterium]|nr:hypothetical protein [Pseudonocardiales bacterium]
MREFAGCQPLVGEVVGLRTFRIDDSGALLPLHSDGSWYDGPNTAVCSPPTGHHPRGPHPVPDAACECGFYAYGTEAAAAQNRNCRYVHAVVSCWGGVVAGTKGFRAEHARVDAIWISERAPEWLRRRVAVRYPSARMYANASAMLAEHPLSELACYRGPARRRALPAVLAAVAGAALIALGLLPLEILHAHSLLWDLWLAVVTAGLALTTWLIVGTRDAGHLAAAFVAAGVVAWLVAPAFGLSGWLLRVPLLRGIVVGVGGYLLGLRPRHFPVVRTPRERAFCGVRA